MRLIDELYHYPRLVGALCAIGATGLGLVYLALAGAPVRDLAVNGAALALGFAVMGVLALHARSGRVSAGVVNLVLGCALLLTSVFGASMDGATRWIAVGGLVVQPSFLVLPVMAIGFARASDKLSTMGIVIAALALALQPDRAMAGALMEGLAALALLRRERFVMVALAAASAGFATTLLRADTLQAMPFVEQVFRSSFAVHPLAGIAAIVGAVLMILPAIIGGLKDVQRREVYAVFGTVWLTVLVAALLANYPTPLVGYGGSAIVGYVIGLLGLPPGIHVASTDQGMTATRASRVDHDRNLRFSSSYS